MLGERAFLQTVCTNSTLGLTHLHDQSHAFTRLRLLVSSVSTVSITKLIPLPRSNRRW